MDFGTQGMNRAWEAWQWNPTRPDAPITTLQRQIVRAFVRDGESLRRLVVTDGQLRVLEIDALDLPLHRDRWQEPRFGRSGRYLGIDVDTALRPTAYHFVPYQARGGPPYTLPAHAVVHTFKQIYANQVRGISWLRAAVTPADRLEEYEDATIRLLDLVSRLPGFFTVDKQVTSVDPVAADAADGTGRNPGGRTAMQVLEHAMRADPDERVILPDGASWEAIQLPGQVGGGAFNATRQSILARIARAAGLSYHTVSGDVASANFSSLRHARLQDQATYVKAQGLLLEALKRIVTAFIEVAVILDTPGARSARPIYTTPTWPFIEPGRELSAQKTAVGTWLRSRGEIIRESGRDPEQVYAELEAEEARIRAATGATE